MGINTMTELCQQKPTQQQQQQSALSEKPSLLDMPSYYPSTNHRDLISENLSENEDNDDALDKQAFIVHVFQHWKLKTLEHQQQIQAAAAPTVNNDPFSKAHEGQHASPSHADASNQSDTSMSSFLTSTDKNGNKEELRPEEPEKPITTMKKRVTPIQSPSYLRRNAQVKRNISMPIESTNPKLLTPHSSNRLTTASTKKSSSTSGSSSKAPVFIAPKKKQLSPTRTLPSLSFDETLQIKPKAILERKGSCSDDNPSASTTPTSWSPAPPTRTRSFLHSSFSSVDDDETSSNDDDQHESLILRNKTKPVVTVRSNKPHILIDTCINIPSAIIITDPRGHCRTFDPNKDSNDDFNDDDEQFVDDITTDSIQINPQTLAPNILFDLPSPPSVMITPATPPMNVDRRRLQSIGEETEENTHETAEKNNHDAMILSKEFDRIEAFSKSRQNTDDKNDDDNNEQSGELEKEPLDRRWSDGVVANPDEESTLSTSPLVKMASATVISKPPFVAPVKMSMTKYILMKLHLTSKVSNKTAESNTATASVPRKRTVRRSTDKKRYQTQ